MHIFFCYCVGATSLPVWALSSASTGVLRHSVPQKMKELVYKKPASHFCYCVGATSLPVWALPSAGTGVLRHSIPQKVAFFSLSMGSGINGEWLSLPVLFFFFKVGQNRINTYTDTVYLVISKQKIPYAHSIYMVLASPILFVYDRMSCPC